MAKRIGPVLAVIGSDVSGFTNGLTTAQKQLQQFSATASVAGARASAVWAATFGAISAFALKTGADFELAFANVKKTVDGSQDDFKKLEAGIRGTAQEFGIAATKIADLARIGGQLGIGVKDLDQFTRTIARLSIAAAELDPEVAARGLSRLAALTGEGAPAIEKMANVLAKLGDTLPTTEDRILDFSSRVASFGSAVGLSSEEILGLSAGFSALVGGTERAATAVERFLGEMAKSAAEGGESFQKFADLAAMSLNSPIQNVEQFADLFSKKPIEAVELVIGGMHKLGEEGLAPLLQQFDALGISGVRMLSTFAAGAKGADVLSQALAVAKKEAEEQTKLDKELAVQLDTVSRQFDRLKAALVEVGIRLFQAFKDQINFLIDAGFKLVGTLQSVAKWVGDLGPVTKFAILGFVGMTGAAAALLVVLGTLGGLVTGMAGLFTTVATVMAGTGTAAAAAGTQLSLFGTGAGGAAAQGGLLTKILAPLSGGFEALASGASAAAGPVAAIIAGLLGGTAAMQGASRAAAELEGNFSDAAEAGVMSAGLIATTWAGVKEAFVVQFQIIEAVALGVFRKIADAGSMIGDALAGLGRIIADNFSTAFEMAGNIAESALRAIFGDEIIDNFVSKLQSAGSAIGEFFKQFAPEGLALAFDELGDQATKVAEGLLHVLGQFPPSVQEVTAAQRYMAEQLGVTITAMDTAQSVGVKLINAQREQAKSAQESAEGQKQLAETAAKVKQANADVVNSLLMKKKEEDAAKEIAKALGLNEKELTAIIQEQGKGFLASAKAIIDDKKARDEWNKAVEQQKKALQGLTIKAAVDELKQMQQALDASKLSVEDFTKEGINQLGEKLADLAATTGQTLGPKGKEIVEKFFDQALAQADIGVNALRKKFEGLTLDLPQMKRPTLSAGELAAGAGINTGFESEKAAIREKELKAIQDQMKEADKEAKQFGKDIQILSDTFNVLGISADSAIGQILGGLAGANLAGAQFKSSFLELKGVLGKEGAGIKDLLSGEGLSAGLQLGGSIVSGVSSIIQATAGGGIKGAFGGALAGGKLGGEIGGMFGPIGETAGAVIGASIGAAIGLLRGKPEFKKIMEDTGRDWGVDISEQLAKQIEETEKRLNVGRFEATLLNIGDVISEAGGVAEFGIEKATKAVGDLFNAVAMGAVPAAEGVAEIGEVFGQLADETFKAGTIADASLLALIERSRQLGIEVPEIAEFISGQLAQAAAGVTDIIGKSMEVDGKTVFGGIQVASAEDAQAQATIFSAAFFATLKEQGLIAAVDAFGPAFEEMKKKFEEFGSDIDFGGVERFFDLANDPTFRPLIEGVQGLTDAMTGLGNAGYLTTETFSAFQQQGAAAFDQLVASGLTSTEALQQIAPFLQEAINASQTFGFELDANTQSLIDQAEAAGIGFKTDPMQQMVEVLKLIAGELGVTQEALAGIGDTAAKTGEQVNTAFGSEGTGPAKEGLDLLTGGGKEAFNELGMAAQAAGNEIGSAINTGSNEAKLSTEDAAVAAQTAWQETTTLVSDGFTELSNKITADYVTIAEQTLLTSEAVTSLGETAFNSVAGFDAMADAARRAAEAAGAANNAGGGEGPANPPRAGQFGLTTTVREPTMFLAGEAGEERVTIDPGGGGHAGGGAPSVVVLQIDGKTIGKVLGDLSRTGDVRIHPSAVKDFG